MQLKKIQMTVLSASLTALMCSGVTQASDLQIYAMPTAGQKTIVMMLDTSGSMTNSTGVSGVNRLQAMKNGLNAVLNSTDPKLDNIVMGLGHYSYGGDGKTGVIKVEAKKLGAVGSTQRTALKNAVANLSASGNTPTAHAYAEAAAYLMGTSPILKSSTALYAKTKVAPIKWYKQECSYWGGCSWNEINALSDTIINKLTSDSDNNYTYYYSLKNSSFYESEINTRDGRKYKSPLPESSKRVSCDGQGIYILSDGEPNGTSDLESQELMNKVLSNPDGTSNSDFTCSASEANLSNINNSTGWKCMGAFAQKLYSNTNYAGVKIQTAFVGFGSDFNSLSKDNVKNACQLGSRLKGDSCSYYQNDGLTKNNVTYANPVVGYGNGGFYTGNSANDVTTSVLNFIDNLGTDPLAPLPTGAISVPVDALNPNGLQSVGFLRMLEPNPAQPSLLTWVGNLKKYSLNNGVLVDGATNIFNAQGEFATATKNLWGARTQNDGGKITIGGAYEMMPVPITSSTAKLRKVFTDAGSSTETTITPLSTLKTNGDYDVAKPLMQIPKLATGTISSKDTILNQFRNQEVLKSFPMAVRLKLLNYLGFKVDTALESIPADSEVSYEATPYFSMGGIIHSFPVQMTYSGTVTESGELATGDIELKDKTILKPRKQSILYGSMEGGLHIVDGATGEEQMAFVPTEILNNQITSNALVKGGSGSPAPAHGVDSPWIVDSEYRFDGVYPNSQIKATKMNVFGGLRMGGSSYYALDVLDVTAPKLKFRISAGQTGYERMGQSWSKPVLINIKYNGVPTRAMVVGGGYDECYENPRFTLSNSATASDSTTCSVKTRAKGNAVYVVDAETGKRLFWVSNTGSDADNANLRHSIVSRISTLDRDGDGYTDHLYFGDLGGQVFRVDMDNYQTKTTTGQNTTFSNFGVRTVRLANLATTSAGALITNGDNPRFYEPLTLTIHDESGKTFILVGAASGDRSTPLDVAPTVGRDGLSPLVALTNRPVNKVYGIFDLDFSKTDLITNTSLTGDYTSTTTEQAVPLKNRLITRNLTLADLLANPQTSIAGNETIYSKFFSTTAPKYGWYRSLSWSWDTSVTTGAEVANNTFRQSGGLKAFEEPIAIGNNLFVSVYDPEGTGVAAQNPCLPSVIGETDRQQYCLPFGVCVTSAGAVDSGQEKKSGYKLLLADGKYKNTNVIGKGIQGLALANNGGGGESNNSCGNYTLSTNTEGLGNWQCTRKLNPTRWFEKR